MRFFKGLLTLALSVLTAAFLGVTAFAAEETTVRYSNELTSSPLRIFFAVLVVILFIAGEIIFERLRERHIQKRNGEYADKDNK